MRSINKFTLAAMLGTLALTSANADEWDKKTTITINAPVQIPSTILQPGTYTLKLLDSSSDRHIVTVWDKDGMHLITTILAIPNYRLKPTDKSKFTMWETPAGEPEALRAWFYPGDNFGQEFAYPKAKAQHLAMVSHTEVPTLSNQDESKYGNGGTASAQGTQMTTSSEPSTTATAITPATAPAPTTTEPVTASTEPTPATVAAAPAPTPEPVAAPTAAAADPAPAPVTTTEQAPAAPDQTPMPQTASNWNETMSLGLLFSLTGLSTFLVRKNR